MDKALTLDIHGIKCDNKDCNYKDMSVKMEDYDKWLNKPCPECGQNLLTQEDYDISNEFVKLTNMINKIFPGPINDEPLFKTEIEMNGSGKFKLGEIKPMV